MNIQNFHESQFHAVEKKWPSKYNKNHKYQVVENGDGCVDVLSDVGGALHVGALVQEVRHHVERYLSFLYIYSYDKR